MAKSRKRFLVLAVLVAPPLLAAFVYLFGQLVKWLWNSLMPPIFGLPAITFWQGLGLLLLFRIFFGGFHFGGSGEGPRMTDEERERFRQRMRERFCGLPSVGSSHGTDAAASAAAPKEP